MKHHFLRRLTAAALALAVAVSLAVTPALATGTTPAPSVTITPSPLTVKMGETGNLEAAVENLPADVPEANLNYAWSCNPTDTADVTSTTKTGAAVTSKKAGNATITVKVYTDDPNAPLATNTCALTVTDAPVNVPLDGLAIVPNTLELTVGGEDTLTVSFTPANASDKNVTWSADASGVVSVDQTGKVKALEEGTATVTVTGEGGKTATCKVTVKAGSTTPPTTPPDPSKDIKSISFISNSEILFNRVTSDPTGVKLSLNPDDAQYNPEDIVWSCVDDKGEPSKVAKVEDRKSVV